jgi:hypothetical protein
VIVSRQARTRATQERRLPKVRPPSLDMHIMEEAEYSWKLFLHALGIFDMLRLTSLNNPS